MGWPKDKRAHLAFLLPFDAKEGPLSAWLPEWLVEQDLLHPPFIPHPHSWVIYNVSWIFFCSCNIVQPNMTNTFWSLPLFFEKFSSCHFLTLGVSQFLAILVPLLMALPIFQLFYDLTFACQTNLDPHPTSAIHSHDFTLVFMIIKYFYFEHLPLWLLSFVLLANSI